MVWLISFILSSAAISGSNPGGILFEIGREIIFIFFYLTSYGDNKVFKLVSFEIFFIFLHDNLESS